MKFLYLGKKTSLKKVRKEKKIYRAGKKAYNAILGGLVLIAVILYLVHSNSLLTRGYEIKKLEQKLEDLENAKKDLESKSIQLQSLSALTNKIDKLKMTVIDSAKYVIPQDREMVKN